MRGLGPKGGSVPKDLIEGFLRLRPRSSTYGCKSPLSLHRYDQVVIGQSECQHRLQVDGWRMNA